MLFRFSLYGFLKNQRYFEPFLYLALMEKGLSFFVIGLLIAFREIIVNAFEIPSGAIADLFGRRKAMILSFVSYTGSFIIFGLAATVWMFFLAMFFFAIGEAFRTGTHKAMIFTWLRDQGREHERTRVYGYTRSWSQIGSAVSVVLAAVFVFATDNYTSIFFLSAIPCILNIINFLSYPRNLDHNHQEGEATSRGVMKHIMDTLRDAVKKASLRRLVFESMGFEGVFHAVKDYLQPVIAAAAIALLVSRVNTQSMSEIQQSSLLIGAVYVVLFLLAAFASRKAHVFADAARGEDRAARRLWAINFVIFAGLGAAAYYEFFPGLILAFMLIHILQNLWRPILISRFDTHSTAAQGATILSIESQSRRVATMIFAPIIGYAIDMVARNDYGGAFWPIGVLGVIIAAGFFISARK